jgi:uncharacterized DUF497 family protein
MADWDRLEGFDWDDGNARKSTEKHAVSQAEAEQLFFNQPLLVVADVKHSQREPRFHALGKTEAGRLLHVTFTWRANQTRLRIISARPMSRKEKAIYAKASQEDSGIQE